MFCSIYTLKNIKTPSREIKDLNKRRAMPFLIKKIYVHISNKIFQKGLKCKKKLFAPFGLYL